MGNKSKYIKDLNKIRRIFKLIKRPWKNEG